jgi:2-iminobutanoate/2-iminopropanoate deaminase
LYVYKIKRILYCSRFDCEFRCSASQLSAQRENIKGESIMTKQQITTKSGASPIGAYSQGLRVGDFIFVSGQGPLDPATGQIVGTTVEEQTARVLENIKAILEAGGATMADVVKVTAHLSDLDLFQRYNKVYATYFPDPKPTRTTVGSQLLGILVEIDAIAYVGES